MRGARSAALAAAVVLALPAGAQAHDAGWYDAAELDASRAVAVERYIPAAAAYWGVDVRERCRSQFVMHEAPRDPRYVAFAALGECHTWWTPAFFELDERQRCILVVHELGHLLGYRHEDAGIMRTDSYLGDGVTPYGCPPVWAPGKPAVSSARTRSGGVLVRLRSRDAKRRRMTRSRQRSAWRDIA